MAEPEASLMSKCIAEFIGTFLLVLTIGCNVLSGNSTWAGVSIACVLMVAIYAFGKISGGNFNPAVSVALGIVQTLGGKGGMEWKMVGIYALVQVVAGLLGGVAYSLLFWEQFNLQPAKGFGLVSAGVCEMLYTFMLCFVVLNVAAAKKSEANQWYGLAIGFVIIAGAYGAGAVSGGCFNPAVAIGIDLSSANLGLGWCLVYTLFHLIGAALASVLFMVVRPEEFRDMEGQPKPLTAKLVSEFLGTFMLVLTVGLNVLANSKAGAFSIAASLTCMIYALGDVSGAHFNPAVTAAISCYTRTMGKEAGYYIAVQLLAGIWAGMTYWIIYDFNYFPLLPVHEYVWVQVVTAEMLFTFILCFVVLCTAVNDQTKSKDFFGLAIGSCVTVGGYAIGSITGGSLNPAVSFGIASTSILSKGSFSSALAYSAFEFIGGIGAALVVNVTHKDEPATKKVEEVP